MTHTGFRTSLLALLLLLAPAGCDSGDASTGGVCEPGATQTCVCPDASGAQSCNAAGTGWEACQCVGGGGGGSSADATTHPGDDDALSTTDATGTTTPDDAVGPGPDDCTPSCLGGQPMLCDADGQQVVGDPCDPGTVCEDGVCVDLPCEPKASEGCDGDLLVWIDSCGQLGDTIEDCSAVGYCSNGECVEACLPQHEKRCVGNDVYWFDSCGSEGGQAEACDDDEFCDGCQPEDANCSKEGQCVKATLSGTWSVTANPSSQSVMGGDVPFLPAMISLEVDGTDVTGYAEVGVYVIDYTGTLTGKNLKMTGEYVESSALGDVNHVEVYDVHFSDPETFSGLNSDTFTLPVLGDTTIYWNVTGVKQ